MYRILLVDDEPNILHGMKILLENNLDMPINITLASDGVSAMQLMQASEFHLLISDVKMPGIGGIELMKYVAEHYPDCQIVLLTGFGEFDDIYVASAYTQVKYVLKIEDESTILDAIRDSLSKVKPETISPFSAQNVSEHIDAYICENIFEDLSLNNIADKFHFNTSYLSRIYKKQTGMVLTDFIRKKKLEMAKELLLTNKYTVEEIAKKLNFSSASYFITFFKNETGVTPKKYIER